ncbi:MAG: hypothetical protein ACFFE2_10810 [Candidatus Thorarchaeota archaeon]
MKIRLIFATVFILLIFLPNTPASSISRYDLKTGHSTRVTDYNPVFLSTGDNSSLTWTSRWSSSPQKLINNSEIVGDHVVLNATFPSSMNVIHTELKLENGFQINTTRSLVLPTGNPDDQFSGNIDHDQFDWIVVRNIEEGLTINLTMYHTNGDSDLMVWSGAQNYSLFSYANNLVQMTSGRNPETDTFEWEYDNDTMYIGCLNYDATPGNWTLILSVGVHKIIADSSNSIVYDTYTLERRNQTLDVQMTGTTSLNETIVFNYQNITICNFFKPKVIVHEVADLGGNLRNITWSATDLNANDTNYFSVWLTNDWGWSFQLLKRNLTRTYYVWNSSGFLWNEDSFFRIRAFSVDLVSGLASVDDESNYWPGDYTDAYSPHFVPTPPPPPLPNIAISHPQDITYSSGVTGNFLVWEVQCIYDVQSGLLTFSEAAPFDYQILRDGELVRQADWVSGNISICVDNLTLGTHVYELTFENPGPDGGIISDEVLVTVREHRASFPVAFLGTIAGVSIGVIVSIVLVSLKSNRQFSRKYANWKE